MVGDTSHEARGSIFHQATMLHAINKEAELDHDSIDRKSYIYEELWLKIAVTKHAAMM